MSDVVELELQAPPFIAEIEVEAPFVVQIEVFTGPTGPTGPQGEPGADSTVPGPEGPQGETGPAGADTSAVYGDPVTVAHGGTGAANAPAARTSLGAASTDVATPSVAGLESAADKTKLDGIHLVEGVADSVAAMGLIIPDADDTTGIIIKSPDTAWGVNGSTAGGGDPLYGTGQFLSFHKEGPGTASDNLLFRVDRTGGPGTCSNMHIATGLRQRAGYAPTQCLWIQPYVNAHGLVIHNPSTENLPSGWTSKWLSCVDVRQDPVSEVFSVALDAVHIRHAGGLQSSGGWTAALGSSFDICSYVKPPSTTDLGLVVRGQPAHTANLIEVQNSDSEPVATVDPAGNIVARNGLSSQTSLGSVSGFPGVMLGLDADAWVVRAAASVVHLRSVLQLPERATVDAPNANDLRVGARDVDGNTELYVRFNTGAEVPIARQGSASVIAAAPVDIDGGTD